MLNADCESRVCQSSICLAIEDSRDQQLSVLQAQNSKLHDQLNQLKQAVDEEQLQTNTVERRERRLEQQQQQEEDDLSDYDDVDYDDEATISFEETNSSNTEVIQSATHDLDKWNSSCAERPGPHSCMCEQIDVATLSASRWNTEFLGNRPVLINFPEGAASWTDPSLWMLDRLRRRYGQAEVMVGYSDLLVKNRGRGYNMMRLRDYIDYHMLASISVTNSSVDGVKAAIRGGEFDQSHLQQQDLTSGPRGDLKTAQKDSGLYVFDSDFYPESDLRDSMHQPSFLPSDFETTQTLWFMGKANSSVAFHRHEDSWCGLVQGQKRWWLYPPHMTPPGGPFPSFEQQDWVDNILPILSPRHKPLQCEQRAGQIL
jgi:hypothetical protein